MLRAETIESWRIHNPDLDTSPMTIVALIKEISEGVGRAVDDIYTHSLLSHADVELLVPLRYQTESVTAIRLAERLGMSRAGVSKTLSRLEERGIVVRTPDPTDKRSASVRLTKHGEHLVDDMFPRELASHAAILDRLGKDRDHVITALELLAQTFR